MPGAYARVLDQPEGRRQLGMAGVVGAREFQCLLHRDHVLWDGHRGSAQSRHEPRLLSPSGGRSAPGSESGSPLRVINPRSPVGSTISRRATPNRGPRARVDDRSPASETHGGRDDAYGHGTAGDDHRDARPGSPRQRSRAADRPRRGLPRHTRDARSGTALGDPGGPPRVPASGAAGDRGAGGGRVLRDARRGRGAGGERLEPFAAACGIDEARTRAYEPLPGCQAYPSYVAWLALNASPTDTVLAITANFSAWGGYCAIIAQALRTHYGFKGDECAFFDFFAEPSPELDRKATAAVQAGLDAGFLDEERAHGHGRLLQSYEALFWSTLLQLA